MGVDVKEVSQLDVVVRERIASNEYDQQRVLELLPDGSRRLLRAAAVEGCVKAPQSDAFIARHGLRTASSVKAALKTLVEKEMVYPGPDGYVVYDRLLAEWLRRLTAFRPSP